MRNNRTNARRRAARRYIKNHSMSMAKWIVDIVNTDETAHINNFLVEMPYETYIDIQNSMRNPQDRHKLKAWYYSGYNVNNRPPKLMAHMLYFNLRRHISFSQSLTTASAEDIDPEAVETPDIDPHVESKYIIEPKSDKA